MLLLVQYNSHSMLRGKSYGKLLQVEIRIRNNGENLRRVNFYRPLYHKGLFIFTYQLLR